MRRSPLRHCEEHLRRSNPEPFRGDTLDCRNDGARGIRCSPSTRISIADTAAHSRGVLRPSFASSRHPLLSEGAGKTGCRQAPAVHCAKVALQNGHSGIQVMPETTRPSLRSGFTAYAELSPGSDALLPPSPCGSLMRAPGWAARITTRLGAQTPGARTTRFCRTRTAPVVCAMLSLTVSRPAKPIAPTRSSVHHGSSRVS